MVNLNPHDILFLDSAEFEGFRQLLESEYKFEIISTSLPKIVSFTSRKLILHTTRGDFFLKEKPAYCSDEISLQRAANFQAHASNRLTFVPPIALTQAQSPYVEWSGKKYFLAAYVTGRYFNGSDNDLRGMLVALREFQRCGGSYLDAHQGDDSDEFKSFKTTDVTRGVLDLGVFCTSEEEREIHTQMRSVYQDLSEEYRSAPCISYVMAHSDYILFNILLNNNSKVVAVNDFDNVKVLPRIHDMAEFLVSSTLLNYIAPLTNLKLPIFLEPQMKAFEIILTEYNTHFDMELNEKEVFGTTVELIWLWSLTLAVFKGDYTVLDLRPAVEVLRARTVNFAIRSFCV